VDKGERLDTGARSLAAEGRPHALTGDEIVSMNFWGFTPAVFGQLERLFTDFLRGRGADPKAEFYLPTALSTLNERGEAKVSLLRSSDEWFGLTYREDLAAAQLAVGALVKAGRYPAPLWK
jgi:hypothetical protein